MKHTLFKALTATGAAALLLAACDSGSADGGSSDEASSQDPVYTEMASWDACEVLDNLQPITDYMGVKGYGSSSAEGGEPGNQEIGNTLDPEAIGCGSLFNLGEYEGFGMNGEIKVKIVPTESEEEAAAAYEERASGAEAATSEGESVESVEIAGQWDQGMLYSWTVDDAGQWWVHAVAQDGQWVFDLEIHHVEDVALDIGDDPYLPFTPEERNQWLTGTYLPEVNQTVNDLIAEVQ